MPILAQLLGGLPGVVLGCLLRGKSGRQTEDGGSDGNLSSRDCNLYGAEKPVAGSKTHDEYAKIMQCRSGSWLIADRFRKEVFLLSCQRTPQY